MFLMIMHRFVLYVGLLIDQGGHKPGKPGILRVFSDLQKLRYFNLVQPRGKIVASKVVFFVIQIFV